MQPVRLILGVDGGGTGTVALLARATAPDGGAEVVGRGESGPSNLRAVGAERCTGSLCDAIDAAFRDAGMERQPVAAACLGLAGADRSEEKQILAGWAASRRLAERLRFENDAVTVLAAGTPAASGLAVIAGTGSMALARSGDGRTDRAGGWGYLLGDEGSGYAVALAGLRRVVRAHDGRDPPTGLAARFLDRLRLDRVESLVPALYRADMDRAAIAALACVVSDAAIAGDASARSIIERAGEELAEVAAAAARARFGPDPGRIPVAVAGGFLLSCKLLEHAVITGLKCRGIEPDPVTQVLEPALGAVRLAQALLV